MVTCKCSVCVHHITLKPGVACTQRVVLLKTWRVADVSTCLHPQYCAPFPCVCLQRTCEIWAFAFSFAWKYFLLNQKWTYPKKQGGMTPQAVSDRKKELAGQEGGVSV